MVMNCSHCQRPVPPDAAFCPACGQPLGRSPAEPPPAEPLPAGTPSAGGDGPAASAAAENFPLSPPGSREDDVEQELWQGTYSPKAMIPTGIIAALLTAIALIAALALGLKGAWLWTLFLGGVLVVWLCLLLRLGYLRLNVSYRLTTQRFVHEEGILRRVTDRIEVIDIDDVTFEQGLIDRLVGVGSIRLSSSDRTHGELWLRGIEQVQEVASQIDAARRHERVRRGLHIEAV